LIAPESAELRRGLAEKLAVRAVAAAFGIDAAHVTILPSSSAGSGGSWAITRPRVWSWPATGCDAIAELARRASARARQRAPGSDAPQATAADRSGY
jgi:hypothetical protein